MREGREDGQREGRERKEGGRKGVGKEGREKGLPYIGKFSCCKIFECPFFV